MVRCYAPPRVRVTRRSCTAYAATSYGAGLWVLSYHAVIAVLAGEGLHEAFSSPLRPCRYGYRGKSADPSPVRRPPPPVGLTSPRLLARWIFGSVRSGRAWNSRAAMSSSLLGHRLECRVRRGHRLQSPASRPGETPARANGCGRGASGMRPWRDKHSGKAI